MLLLTFTAGANRYAIDVTRVVEVVPRVELRKISHAPACLAGLLGYRGHVVPVIDLGLLLETAPCEDCLSTRIILVNDTPDDQNRLQRDRDNRGEDGLQPTISQQRDLTFLGLVAEHVSDLTEAQPDQIVPFPVCLPQTPYLGAIVQTERGIVQLILVEKVRQASLHSSQAGQNESMNSLSNI